MVLDFKIKNNDANKEQSTSSSSKSDSKSKSTVNLTKVRKTQCLKLSQKMKKIKVTELPGEFGIMFPKKKKPGKDVIEIVDSDDENTTGIKAKTPKEVSAVSAVKKTKALKPKKPKPDTNSTRVFERYSFLRFF